jgi:hypothetical protein
MNDKSNQQDPVNGNHNFASSTTLAHHRDDSCASCLWTGVITCIGLSAYFAHAAYDESPPVNITTSQPVVNKIKWWQRQHQSRYTRPVFLLISTGWLGIGAYRWYLG